MSHAMCRYGRADPLHSRTVKMLDPGIRRAVVVLHDHGIETYESCEGGPGHSYAEPSVRFHGGPGEGYRAVAIAIMNGLPVVELRRLWTVNIGSQELDGPTWQIVFMRST